MIDFMKDSKTKCIKMPAFNDFTTLLFKKVLYEDQNLRIFISDLNTNNL